MQIFRGRILDVSPDQLMIEISGQEKKIEAFIEQVRPYGIHELARTGRIALVAARETGRLEAEPRQPSCGRLPSSSRLPRGTAELRLVQGGPVPSSD